VSGESGEVRVCAVAKPLPGEEISQPHGADPAFRVIAVQDPRSVVRKANESAPDTTAKSLS
jgi:hypothetical protein